MAKAKTATVSPSEPSMTKYGVYAMAPKVLAANIRKVGTNSKALDQLIHKTAVATFIHSLPHSVGGHLDANKAGLLLKAMTKGQSRLRLVAWFEHFTNIRVTTDKDEKTKDITFKVSLVKPGSSGYKDVTEAMVVKANDTPFWALNQEREPTPVVIDDVKLAKMLASLVGQIKKARDAGNLNLTPMGINMVTSLTKTAETADKRAKGLVQHVGTKALAKAAEKHVDPLTIAA